MRHAEEAAEFGERGKRFLPKTLADLLPGLLGEAGRAGDRRPPHRPRHERRSSSSPAPRPRPKHLTAQFRKHTADRRYLALVRGTPAAGRIESVLVRDRGDGRRGSSPTRRPDGKRAVTHVKVLEQLGRVRAGRVPAGDGPDAPGADSPGRGRLRRCAASGCTTGR